MFKRHFTIMVVPDAQALLRRFHIRGGQIAGGIVGLVVLVVLAMSSPLLVLWSVHQARQISRLEEEKRHIETRTQEIEQTVTDLRQKLTKYDRGYSVLAYMAGLEVQPPKPAKGEGNIVDLKNPQPAARFDQLKSEADELAAKSSLLDRRIPMVEQAIGSRQERLAHFPSMLPIRGLIGAGFGWRRDPFTGLSQFHSGLDICAPVGTPVKAPADGIVIKAERDAGYGMTLTISHGDGVITRYGHLSAFRAQPGQKVKRGDLVALVGNTGRSTGAHVHFEIWRNGRAVDPAEFIQDDALF